MDSTEGPYRAPASPPPPAAVTIPPPTPIDHSIERLRLIRDVLYLSLFVAAAITFALTGHEVLAGTAFGAASSYAVPAQSRIQRPGLAAALALIGGTIATGIAS